MRIIHGSDGTGIAAIEFQPGQAGIMPQENAARDLNLEIDIRDSAFKIALQASPKTKECGG